MASAECEKENAAHPKDARRLSGDSPAWSVKSAEKGF
jgi:hypothetical protein